MLWLYILLGIIIFFTLILLIPVKLDISSTDKTELYLKILFVKIKLSPRKKKINIKKYSPKAMEKARKKAEKKALAKQKKILKKKLKPQKTKEKKPSKIKEIFKHPTDIPAFVTDVYDIISILVGKFSKRIKINVKSCNIVIGTDNAAKTAIVYGAVCAGINALLSLLVQFTNYDERDTENINISPDFTSEKIQSSIYVRITLRPGQLFTFLFSVLPEIFRVLDYI